MIELKLFYDNFPLVMLLHLKSIFNFVNRKGVSSVFLVGIRIHVPNQNFTSLKIN